MFAPQVQRNRVPDLGLKEPWYFVVLGSGGQISIARVV